MKWLRRIGISLAIAAVLSLSGISIYAYVPLNNSSQLGINFNGNNGSDLVIESSGALSSNLYDEFLWLPAVTTQPASGIDLSGYNHSATIGGTLDDMGGALSVNVYLEWGYDTSYGNVALTTIATAPGTFTTTITPGSRNIVHYRIRVSNGAGTGNGADMTFTIPTNSTIPMLWYIMHMVPTLALLLCLGFSLFLLIRAKNYTMGLTFLAVFFILLLSINFWMTMITNMFGW